jgi:hypothetical protein
VRGPYTLVRHPIYTGYLVTHVGFLMAHPTAQNVAVILIADAALILRALMEERVLSADTLYQQYCRRVGWHLVPGCSDERRPDERVARRRRRSTQNPRNMQRESRFSASSVVFGVVCRVCQSICRPGAVAWPVLYAVGLISRRHRLRTGVRAARVEQVVNPINKEFVMFLFLALVTVAVSIGYVVVRRKRKTRGRLSGRRTPYPTNGRRSMPPGSP